MLSPTCRSTMHVTTARRTASCVVSCCLPSRHVSRYSILHSFGERSHVRRPSDHPNARNGGEDATKRALPAIGSIGRTVVDSGLVMLRLLGNVVDLVRAASHVARVAPAVLHLFLATARGETSRFGLEMYKIHQDTAPIAPHGPLRSPATCGAPNSTHRPPPLPGSA